MSLKYNLKEQLMQKNEELQGSLSVMGMSAMTQFSYNNSMRTVMLTSYLRQLLNLSEPEFPGVFTNLENTVGKYSSGYKKAKKNFTVYKKIEKYSELLDTPYYYKLFVYYEKQNKYDVITRKPCENLTEAFGYDCNNEVIDELLEDDYVEKGSVLYKSTSYDEEMNYAYGVNAKIMLSLDPHTSEDAAIISESLSERLSSIKTDKISIGLNDNHYLINLYGDEDNYQPFPHIGQKARGIIAAKKTLYNNQLLSDFKDSNLNTINYTSDNMYYSQDEVIDIEIFCNNEDIEYSAFNDQIMKYYNAQTRYYQDIYDTCLEIIESGSKYTREIEYLFKRSREILNHEYKWKEGDGTFSNMIINITTRGREKALVGQKITG